MKFPAAQYVGKNSYLAVYNYHPDMSVKLPGSLKARPVAHFRYSYHGWTKGFDVFQAHPGSNPDEFLNVGKEIVSNDRGFQVIDLPKTKTLTRGEISETDTRYDVQAQILAGTDGEVLDLARADIEYFCRGRLAKKHLGTRIEEVQRIVPITEMRKIKPEWILTSGKADFIPQCLLEANIDFAQGCISSWIPYGEAKFENGNFVGYFQSPWDECDYCYAIPDHKPFPKSILDLDFKQLKNELMGEARLKMGRTERHGQPIKVLRFGKRTEASLPFDFGREMLAKTLEVMIETGTKGVMPTKFHEFNSEITELLRRTNSAVLYSVGFNRFEHGPVRYGSTNDWRIEQAIKHREAGVNSAVYLLVYAHDAPEKRELDVIETARKHKVPVQLLPMRFGSKKLVERMTGKSWASMKEIGQVSFDRPEGSCERGCGHIYSVQAGKLVPDEGINPGWAAIVGDNREDVRMCYHNKQDTYCGGCFQTEGIVARTVKVVTPKILGRYRREIRKEKNEPVVPDGVQIGLDIKV